LKIFNSRKISFIPNYFETFGRNQIKTLPKKGKKEKILKNFFSFFVPIFYILFAISKLFLNKGFFPQFKFLYFFENLHFLIFSGLLIFLSVLNFSQKILFSYLYEFNLVGIFCYWLVSHIENLFFFNQRLLMSFFLTFLGNIGIVFFFWNQYKFNWILKNSYSKKVIYFREIRWILTIFSIIKLIIRSRIFFLSISVPNIIYFPPFFVNFSSFLPFERIFCFSKKSLFIKSGGDLLFIFLFLFILIYGGNFFDNYKNRLFFFLEYFKIFKFSSEIKLKKYKQKQNKYESVFLKKDEKNFMYIDNLIIQEYSNHNFSPKKSFNRWNIKKSGINVPFPISLRYNELPFRKKSIKWEIKKK